MSRIRIKNGKPIICKYESKIYKDKLFIDPWWFFDNDQFEIIKAAIDKIKSDTKYFNYSDMRCIELICADFLANP